MCNKNLIFIGAKICYRNTKNEVKNIVNLITHFRYLSYSPVFVHTNTKIRRLYIYIRQQLYFISNFRLFVLKFCFNDISHFFTIIYD